LLTEKLAPLLAASDKPVLVQTSSSSHWAVDGSDLVVRSDDDDDEDDTPIAARPGGSHGYILFRTQRSYSNSKLAQIYHARALKANDDRFQNVRVVSFCPGWVATNIAGSNWIFSAVLQALAFPMEGWGVASALRAMFDSSSSSSLSSNPSDDWYINSNSFRLSEFLVPRPTPSWMHTIPIRDVLIGAMAPVTLVLQGFMAKAGLAVSSPESYNTTKSNSLYRWSKSAVTKYL